MTPGTSPLPLGAASYPGAEADAIARRQALLLWRHCKRAAVQLRGTLAERSSGLVRTLAVGYLAALGTLSMTAWSGVPAEGEGLFAGFVAGIGQLHVAFLMLAGAGMALVTLQSTKARNKFEKPAPVARQFTGLGDLLAQMSHELRTPLNAVIGFSDVMRHELHGPLGNARYQEYVAHISESGGRMLKSSEDALAVAEAMTVLLSREPNLRRERLTAGTIVREAWRAVGKGNVRLDVVTCNACEITCERRATQQAIEHLLREAAGRAGPDGCVDVVGGRRASKRTLVIGVHSQPDAAVAGREVSKDTLATLLARLLLEAQGAHLEMTERHEAGWSATITFGKARPEPH